MFQHAQQGLPQPRGIHQLADDDVIAPHLLKGAAVRNRSLSWLIHWKPIGKPWENDGLMGFDGDLSGDLPSGFMTNITLERSTMFHGKIHYNMVIFE